MREKFDSSWKEWVDYNLKNNCDLSKLFQILKESGFDSNFIYHLLQINYSIPEAIHHKAIITKKAKQYASKLVEIFTIENFLLPYECKRVIDISKGYLQDSTISNKNEIDKRFRTSKSAHFQHFKEQEHVDFANYIEEKICHAVNIHRSFSESSQIQYYQVNNEFKLHTDYFDPGTEEYEECTRRQGQRTWTFMIYLNTVKKGGATYFPHLQKRFYPKEGMAVLWNNLDSHGKENTHTLHAGEKIVKGEKSIITKWFREKCK